MNQFTELFEEFLLKAITQTEAALEFDLGEGNKLEDFTANRDRLFQVIERISQQVDWSTVSDEKRVELSRQVEYIKKLDEKLLVKLQEYREGLKSDIERTVRQKDGIKGYNLNDVK